MTELGASGGEAEVCFEQRGALGLITLNRPKALNALTRPMCREMDTQLAAWGEDSSIRAVAIRGAGERAFCAGGDVRALYESGREGSPYALEFWRDEYRLNARIKHFPKPYVALLHGIVMGGGVGVSVHGSHRIVADTAMFAMPETGIGMFPDVGGSYFLPRCPGETGMYCALTGARLKMADMLYVGVATHAVAMSRWDALIEGLADGGDPDVVLEDLGSRSGPAPMTEYRAWIDDHFAHRSVETILSSLDGGGEWAKETAAVIRGKSPTSLKLSHRQLCLGREMTFDDCMRMEYRMVHGIIAGHDFYEGVRAAIVEKDNRPNWRPADLAGVSDSDIDGYFAPRPENELRL
ncbi:MAG TPA: enoyl-CoA hydratase/isomerase family protein [Rhizomicrobium sp.]|jgi:enoyl-CoA hydratase